MSQQHKKVDVQTAFKSYINKGLKALNEENFSAAIKWSEKSIKIDKKNPVGHHLLAICQERSGNKKLAYKIMSDHNPLKYDIKYEIYKGELAAKNGLYDTAITILSEAKEVEPENTQILRLLYFCHTMKNDKINTYLTLKAIKNITELTLEEKYIFSQSMKNLNFHSDFESTLMDINEMLDEKKIDGRILSQKSGELLHKLYPELHEPESIKLTDSLFSDHLFWLSISKSCICDVKIDLFIMYARKNLLMYMMEKGQIDDDQLVAVQSIGKQNYFNEYIHYVDAIESEIIQGLVSVIELGVNNPDWKPSDSEAIFHILLMYMPLQKLNVCNLLAQHALPSWPTSLQNIVQKTLFSPLEEIELGKETPKITRISNETPLSVNAQYEENPYPRWEGTYCNPSLTLGHYINHLHPNMLLGKEFFNPKMKVLIAGCGTGKQAIDAALLYPESSIVAFDISLRSLGYAQIKAQEYNLKNLEFFHGDILELSDEVGQFDYIECGGVLHHLKDPMLGWQKLLECLKPKGVIRIDLYSKIARQEITQRKHQISQLNIGTSLDSLRIFRRAMIEQNSDHIFYNFNDFFNTSEFRDLLFHTQETQYTLPIIQEAIEKLNLNFLALYVDQDKQNIFRSVYPDGDISDLNLWHEVELQHPKLFASMYAFWCQKN